MNNQGVIFDPIKTFWSPQLPVFTMKHNTIFFILYNVFYTLKI